MAALTEQTRSGVDVRRTFESAKTKQHTVYHVCPCGSAGSAGRDGVAWQGKQGGTGNRITEFNVSYVDTLDSPVSHTRFGVEISIKFTKPTMNSRSFSSSGASVSFPAASKTVFARETRRRGPNQGCVFNARNTFNHAI